MRKLLIVALVLLIILLCVYDLTHLNRLEVAMLSLKGENIKGYDFFFLQGEDVGSGLRIMEYPVDDSYCLRVAIIFELEPWERVGYVHYVNLEDGSWIHLKDADFWDILF